MQNIILRPKPNGQFQSIRFEQGVLTINGVVFPVTEEPLYIDYDERLKCSTFSDSDVVRITVIPSTWVDPNPPPPQETDLEAEALAALEAERAGWVVDRWQIKTVLGKDRWQTIVDFGNSPNAPWGLQTVIEDAQTIPRVSETVELLAWLLQVTADEVDAIFRAAMQLRA